MRRYLSIYAAFFRASLTAALEFRVNFILGITTEALWYAAQVMSFEIIFNHTNSISGWTRPEVRVFLGILFVVDAVYMLVFSSGLDGFSESVRKGSLDLLLTKPVNSQFIISMQKISIIHFPVLVVAGSYLTWALWHLESFSPWRLLWLIVAVPCGAVVFYCFRFFFASTAVIFTRAENLQFLWYNLYRLGMRPDTIYYPWLRLILLSFLPIGLIASVPSRLVLGTASWWLGVWTITTTTICLYLSHRFWNYALKKYASASS